MIYSYSVVIIKYNIIGAVPTFLLTYVAKIFLEILGNRVKAINKNILYESFIFIILSADDISININIKTVYINKNLLSPHFVNSDFLKSSLKTIVSNKGRIIFSIPYIVK